MARKQKFADEDDYNDDWSNDFRDGKRQNRYSERQQNRKQLHGRRDDRFSELMRVDE